MPPIIREFHHKDSIQFLNVVRHLQSYELEIHDRMMPVEAIDEWYIDLLSKQCVEQKGYILVAELSGAVVGYATIFTQVDQTDEIDELSYTYGFISHIAVLPHVRGLGIGKQLLSECERRAVEAGCKWLRIPTLAKNQNAITVYKNFGFAPHLITLEKKIGN